MKVNPIMQYDMSAKPRCKRLKTLIKESSNPIETQQPNLNFKGHTTAKIAGKLAALFATAFAALSFSHDSSNSEYKSDDEKDFDTRQIKDAVFGQ